MTPAKAQLHKRFFTKNCINLHRRIANLAADNKNKREFACSVQFFRCTKMFNDLFISTFLLSESSQISFMLSFRSVIPSILHDATLKSPSERVPAPPQDDWLVHVLHNSLCFLTILRYFVSTRSNWMRIIMPQKPRLEANSLSRLAVSQENLLDRGNYVWAVPSRWRDGKRNILCRLTKLDENIRVHVHGKSLRILLEIVQKRRHKFMAV